MAAVMNALGGSKVGEGWGSPGGASELPLDIQYSKLLDWLVDRKQLPVDWHKRLRLIQARAADLPGGGGSSSTNEPLDYFRMRDTRDRLAEGAERNMVGQLKGDAASWHKLVSTYEKGGVWMGEAAQMLTRNVDLDVPAAKREKARASQALVDLQRRREELLHSAAAAAAAYKQECRELGIAGHNLDAELGGLDRLTAQQLAQAVSSCTEDVIVEAAAYYRAFSEYAHGSGASAALPSLQALHSGDLLPGASEPHAPATPSAEEASQGSGEAATESGAANAAPPDISWDIDFGALDAATAEDAGKDTAAGGGASPGGGISWDVDPRSVDGAEENWARSAAAEPKEAPANAGLDDIDWDVQIDSQGDDTAVAPSGIDWEVTAADGIGAGGSAAAATDAGGLSTDPLLVALMHSSEARVRLLDDLAELQAFLTQRGGELASGAGEALSAVAPDAIQTVGASAVQTQLAAVSGTIDALTGDRIKQLLLIQSSARHRSRLAQHLRQAAAKESKFTQTAEETVAKRVDTQRKLMADASKFAALLERTAIVQKAVVTALSTALNRRVNIIGEINNLS